MSWHGEDGGIATLVRRQGDLLSSLQRRVQLLPSQQRAMVIDEIGRASARGPSGGNTEGGTPSPTSRPPRWRVRFVTEWGINGAAGVDYSDRVALMAERLAAQPGDWTVWWPGEGDYAHGKVKWPPNVSHWIERGARLVNTATDGGVWWTMTGSNTSICGDGCMDARRGAQLSGHVAGLASVVWVKDNGRTGAAPVLASPVDAGDSAFVLSALPPWLRSTTFAVQFGVGEDAEKVTPAAAWDQASLTVPINGSFTRAWGTDADVGPALAGGLQLDAAIEAGDVEIYLTEVPDYLEPGDYLGVVHHAGGVLGLSFDEPDDYRETHVRVRHDWDGSTTVPIYGAFAEAWPATAWVTACVTEPRMEGITVVGAGVQAQSAYGWKVHRVTIIEVADTAWGVFDKGTVNTILSECIIIIDGHWPVFLDSYYTPEYPYIEGTTIENCVLGFVPGYEAPDGFGGAIDAIGINRTRNTTIRGSLLDLREAGLRGLRINPGSRDTLAEGNVILGGNRDPSHGIEDVALGPSDAYSGTKVRDNLIVGFARGVWSSFQTRNQLTGNHFRDNLIGLLIHVRPDGLPQTVTLTGNTFEGGDWGYFAAALESDPFAPGSWIEDSGNVFFGQDVGARGLGPGMELRGVATVLRRTLTWSPPPLDPGESSTLDVEWVGARIGDQVQATFDCAYFSLDVELTARATAPDVVSVRIKNNYTAPLDVVGTACGGNPGTLRLLLMVDR